MSSIDEDVKQETEMTNNTPSTTSAGKTVDSLWNIAGLKRECQRLIQRCHKKIGKAHERLDKAKTTIEQLTAADANPSLEELQNCPDVNSLELELHDMQQRLRTLNQLEQGLGLLKKKESAVLPTDLAELALQLDVDDQPPSRPDRSPTQPKGPRAQDVTRLPYRRYFAQDGTEIRVGKRATDNDSLSLDPLHRHDSDWWMHAAGCPGSHVVIRSHDDPLATETMLDAATLAAWQSKCTGTVVNVSMTRCRNIQKPPGAKPGLVMLTGKVRTVSMNMKEAKARLDRLEQTALIN